MTEILIDANILVYAHDLAEEEKRAQAIRVVYELQQAHLGCLSIQCISEFFKAVTNARRQLLSLDEATEQAYVLLHSFPVFPLTPMIVMDAMAGAKNHGISYYDAQILACAKLNQVPFVFSEDFQDGQTLEGIRFANPFAQTFQLEKWL